MNAKRLLLMVVVLGVMVVMVVALALSAYVPAGATRSAARAEQGTPVSTQPAPLPTWDGTASCAEETAGTRRLVDAVHGFCMLYPAEYTVIQPYAKETVLAMGSLLNVHDARLSIETEQAGERSAADEADALQVELDQVMPGYKVQRSNVRIGDVDAVVLDRVPGQELGRQVLFVRMGVLFRLTFTPADPGAAGFPGMESLYELVTGSFAFLMQ